MMGEELERFWSGTSLEGRRRYTKVKLIGQGAYSVVVRAFDTVAQEDVAIKKISEVFYDAHEAKKVLREIRLLRDFCNPHIISLRALVPLTSLETFQAAPTRTAAAAGGEVVLTPALSLARRTCGW